MSSVLEWAVAALLVLGVLFALVGSWGLAKFDDFFKRVHGPSKATTLGVGCVLVASMLWTRSSGHELLITLFLFLTAPVSAHLLVKAAMKLKPGTRPPPPP
jgi:multicomponent K+:H+ antiporter subunit G